MGPAPSVTCVDLPSKSDGSVSADALPVQDQQHAEEITLQPKIDVNRLPATAEVPLGSSQQLSPAQKQQVICRLLYVPLAFHNRQPSADLHQSHMSAVEGQNCLLDHVVLKDILRVLGDSRSDSFSAPELYASLQVQYLQRIPDSHAENQGRLLVFLEWLTERLLQDSLTAKHEMLYAAVLKLCKASEVALPLPSHHVTCYACQSS